MHVVQQLDVGPVILAQAFEKFRHDGEILRRRPHRLRGQLALGGFVRILQAGNAVSLLDAGHAALRAHRLVALRDVLADFGAALVDVLAVRMSVDERAFARASTEQLVQRLIAHLAEDVPQRDVDRGDCRHRHGAAAPVRTAIEKLPDIFDAARVAADQIRHQVVLEVGRHREFAAVQCCIADTGNT